jgi:hypothetical protein
MTEIDFTDSQLPPDELKDIRQRYREERRAEEERLAGKRARLRLCFGSEDYARSGLGLSNLPLPLIELTD